MHLFDTCFSGNDDYFQYIHRDAIDCFYCRSTMHQGIYVSLDAKGGTMVDLHRSYGLGKKLNIALSRERERESVRERNDGIDPPASV